MSEEPEAHQDQSHMIKVIIVWEKDIDIEELQCGNNAMEKFKKKWLGL